MKGLIAAICFALAAWLAADTFGAELELTFSPHLRTPEFHAWFDKAMVGDRYDYTTRSDCNTCGGAVVKTSEKTVRDTGQLSCTLLACGFAEVQVKP